MHTDSGAHDIVVQICTHLHFRKVKLCKSSPLHNFQLLNLEASNAASEIVQNTLEVVQMCKLLWYRAVVVQLKLWCKCWMWHRATVQMWHSGQFVQPAAVSSVPAGGNLGDPEYKVARQRSSSLSYSYGGKRGKG